MKHGDRWAGRIREVIGDSDNTHGHDDGIGYDDGIQVHQVMAKDSDKPAAKPAPRYFKLPAQETEQPSGNKYFTYPVSEMEDPAPPQGEYFKVPVTEMEAPGGKYFNVPKPVAPTTNKYFIYPAESDNE